MVHYAACGGSLPVVDYLISEQHCDPNSREEKGSTAFSYACEEGHMNIVQYLSGHGGDPALSNKKGDMPIHIACLAGHLSIVKYLINVLKCDPNSKGFQGCTPLHHVCGNDHMDIIKYLIIKQCCDPTFIDSNGMTPLPYHASLSGHTAVVRWLLQDERVHVLNKDKFGRTPINCAELHRDRSSMTTEASMMQWCHAITVYKSRITTLFDDEILDYVHVIIATNMMKWCTTLKTLRVWITLQYINEILDYTQVASKTSNVYWHVTFFI